jgi:hypothetical protein
MSNAQIICLLFSYFILLIGGIFIGASEDADDSTAAGMIMLITFVAAACGAFG